MGAGVRLLPRHAALLALLLDHRACAEVLLSRAAGESAPRQCEAIPANWNLQINDARSSAFAGEVHFEEENPFGCHEYDEERARGRLVLIDAASLCDDFPLTVGRAAKGGATGVVFIHAEQEGVAGIALGNRDPPRIRAVMIERRHGEGIRASLASGPVSAELKMGRLISEEAYEEQFIFRVDEIASTRKVNFLWHEHPEMLPNSGRLPLSSQQEVSVPDGWFSRPPAFVPLFNPSILALEDGSLLATLRMSNGQGCPSVRNSGESSMDTRVFHNALVLAHVDAAELRIQSHVVVETPPLSCYFGEETRMSGRRFLDEVHGPMDARITAGGDGQPWLTFYAEANLPDSDEITRGIHAAPLRVSWRACGRAPREVWSLEREGGAFAEPCQVLGGLRGEAAGCRQVCDETSGCVAVASGPEEVCELLSCPAEARTVAREGWQAWRRTASRVLQWHRRERGCARLGLGRGPGLEDCRASCEEAKTTHLLLDLPTLVGILNSKLSLGLPRQDKLIHLALILPHKTCMLLVAFCSVANAAG